MLNPFGQTQINPQQLGALGQALMQQGYIPNSGMGGIAAQMLNAYLGSQMMNKANAPQITPQQPQITPPGINVQNIQPQAIPVNPNI